MIKSRRILSAVVIAALLVVIVWQYLLYVDLRLRAAFAEEQIAVFSDLTDRAQSSLEQNPADVKAAVQFLAYVRDYYRSGTKQSAGSALDRVVENSRRMTMLRMMEMLRQATGEDAGSEPEDWISTLAGQHSPSR